MKNKPSDIPYCGVRKDEIVALPLESINTEALNVFIHMVSERYKIHIRKDVYKKNPPYTKDPILKKFRFTNVRREHDKETLWLINNIINSDLCYEDKLMNCILFRLFNKSQTSELIGAPICFSEGYNYKDYEPIFKKALKENPKRVFFTGAFNTGGLKRALKWYLPEDDPDNSMEMRVMGFMSYLIDDGIIPKLKKAKSPEQLCETLQSYMGLGKFLSYQIFVDMSYISEFPFSENEYTVAGPGACKGLKFLFKDTGNLTPEELIFWLKDNWKELNEYNIDSGGKHALEPQKLFLDLPEEDRCMNVMLIENCLCEFSKYYKVKNNLGRPRQVYTAGGRK